ncbi:MAG: helix-turn-helix domain-containing protein [bacterium]|jgi:cytoskeletal protein RodZ
MERIGERLRRRREELGLTLEDVSESIRYRPEIISAIEEGRTSVFPAKAYLSAFLRAYAVILELDPREIVREQKSEEERAFEAIRNIRMKPKRRRRIPRKAIYIAVPIVLAAVILLLVDRLLWDRSRDPGGGPAEQSGTMPAAAASARDTARVEAAAEASDAGDQAGEPAAGGESGAGSDDSSGRAQDAPVSVPEAEEQAVPEGSAGHRDSGSGRTGANDRPGEARAGAGAEASPEEARVPLVSDDVPEETREGGEQTSQAPGDREAGRDEVAETAEAAAAPVEAPVAEEPSAEEAVPETAAEPRPHKLVVSARRGAYIRISSAGRRFHDGYFKGGEVDSFYSETPFVIEALTDRGAWTFVQNGERVRLPGSSSEDVSDFEIPVPSGD